MSTAPLPEAPIFDETGAAKERLLSRRGEPLLYANWDNVLFIHYEIEPDELQRCIPYPLDLYHGRAFVSFVAFTMRGMRPRLGGTLGALLFKPIATHHFLNVRTYVRHEGEAGIHLCANGFRTDWQRGSGHGVSDCRISLEKSNIEMISSNTTSMRVAATWKLMMARSVIARR